jgi:hypothetical protein
VDVCRYPGWRRCYPAIKRYLDITLASVRFPLVDVALLFVVVFLGRHGRSETKSIHHRLLLWSSQTTRPRSLSPDAPYLAVRFAAVRRRPMACVRYRGSDGAAQSTSQAPTLAGWLGAIDLGSDWRVTAQLMGTIVNLSIAGPHDA